MIHFWKIGWIGFILEEFVDYYSLLQNRMTIGWLLFTLVKPHDNMLKQHKNSLINIRSSEIAWQFVDYHSLLLITFSQV